MSTSNLEIDSLKKKPERGIYTPPSGKYSTTADKLTVTAAAAAGGGGQGNKHRLFNSNRRGGGRM